MPNVETGRRVVLERSSSWESLPSAIRDALEAGRDRVHALRQGILDRAVVPELPPVLIVDVGLEAPDASGAVLGYHRPVEIGGAHEFGAVLSAPTIVFGTDEVLRGLMLHEFAHAMFYIRAFVEMTDYPERRERIVGALRRHDPLDADLDRSRQDPPALWFAPEDVALFPQHDSPLLSECTRAIQYDWKAKGLPMSRPAAAAASAAMWMPETIVEHIRRNPRPAAA